MLAIAAHFGQRPQTHAGQPILPAPEALRVTQPIASANTAQRGPAPTLVIELDQASQRFVQTLIDEGARTVLRRYPNEEQLAFSRGVNAYVSAMRLKRF